MNSTNVVGQFVARGRQVVLSVDVANLTSLSLDETTSHILATYRPTSRWPNVRHQVFHLSHTGDMSL